VAGSVDFGRATDSSFASASGVGTIDPRSATTGALIESSKPIVFGVFAPRISQLVDGTAWLSDSSGMGGYVERLDASTLGATPMTLPLLPENATNQISAQVFSGVLYIEGPGGGTDFNDCGDAATGQLLAPLRLPESLILVTADATDLFYLRGVSLSTHEELARAPRSQLCLRAFGLRVRLVTHRGQP